MILAGDMQPNFVAVGGGCFNKFWDLWPRAAASAADSAAKVTGQISDPTFRNKSCCRGANKSRAREARIQLSNRRSFCNPSTDHTLVPHLPRELRG
jgi:hypothetical protein